MITLIVAITWALPLTPVEQQRDPVRALTFNIRYDNPADGIHAWSSRRERVLALIESFDADIIALQEVTPSQMEYIRAELGDTYTIRGVGRNDGENNSASGEASPVLYHTDRFREVEWGTWWLSETPDVPGSKGWDAAITRIATWVRLVERASDPRDAVLPLPPGEGRGEGVSDPQPAPDSFLIISTHFDHVGEIARLKSAELLRDKLADEDRVILLGDFNAAPGSGPHTTLTAPQGEEAPAFIDAAGDDDSATWCGWDGQPDEGQRIDWILLRGFDVEAYEVPAWRDSAHPESDHLPVVAEVRLIPEQSANRPGDCASQVIVSRHSMQPCCGSREQAWFFWWPASRPWWPACAAGASLIIQSAGNAATTCLDRLQFQRSVRSAAARLPESRGPCAQATPVEIGV
jgi:endonuclease/exonuclease/phosphatase family metal-dependent hydrolase